MKTYKEFREGVEQLDEFMLSNVGWVYKCRFHHASYAGLPAEYKNDTKTFTIVKHKESNPRAGKISEKSPLARDLKGKKKGDQFVPSKGRAGQAKVEVLSARKA